MKRAGVHRTTQGFTLIELLVALAIVSLVAILSWQGLDNVIRLTQRVRDSDDQWEQMRATLAQLERDLKAVHNPRASLQGAGGGTAGAGGNPQRGTTPPGSPADSTMGRQRAADRDDVIVENDDNLDAVVNTALANTQRVQLKAGALEIISSQASVREGPMSLQVRWPWVNGQWRREQINLTARPDSQGGSGLAPGGSTGLQGSTSTNSPTVGGTLNLTAAQRALFEEPGLRLRGVGIRMWIEGRGWDNEQYLGEPLPQEVLPGPPGGSAAPNVATTPGLGNQPLIPGQVASPGAGQTGPIRLRGVRVRLWLPSGDIYTRVFMLGQES